MASFFLNEAGRQDEDDRNRGSDACGTGDCNNATEFAQGGQFQTSSGASGQWSLAGDQLTLMGAQRLTMQVVIVDQNTINIVNPDG